MKIVIVGGNVRSLVANRGDLIRLWRSSGFEVLAIVPEEGFNDSIDELGIPYKTIRMSRTGINPFFDLFTIFQIRAILLDFMPDYVISYNAKPMIYGSLAAYFSGVERIYSIVTGLGVSFTGQGVMQRLVRYIQLFLYRISLGLNKAVFFQNTDDRDELERAGVLSAGTDRVMIAGSGINVDRFPASLPDSQRPPVFLLITRLIVEKGVMEFAEAARRLRRRYPKARFRLVGYHNSNLPTAVPLEALQRYVESGVIEWSGGLSDVRPALRESSVVVSPSYYREGVPRALLEALSTGRAVITTDMPGCRDTVIDGVNGFLVAPRCVDGLVSAMEKFLSDPELILQFGNASRNLAETVFDVRGVNRVITEAMGLSGKGYR